MQAKNSTKTSVGRTSDEGLITKACEGLTPRTKWTAGLVEEQRRSHYFLQEDNTNVPYSLWRRCWAIMSHQENESKLGGSLLRLQATQHHRKWTAQMVAVGIDNSTGSAENSLSVHPWVTYVNIKDIEGWKLPGVVQMPVSRRLTQRRLMLSKPSLSKTNTHPLENGRGKPSLSRRVFLLTEVPLQARCCHLAAMLSNRNKATPAAFHSSVYT